MEILTKFVCLALVLLVIQTWFYSHIKDATRILSKLYRKIRTTEDEVVVFDLNQKTNEKFEETKSNILGTSQTVLMILLAVLALLPVSRSKAMIKRNIEDINHGYLRKLYYTGKISMPTFTFLLFPLLMLAFNHKVRRSLIRELRETWIGKKILK